MRRQPQARAGRRVADHQIDRARRQPASLRPDEQRLVADVDALGTLLQPRLERVTDGLVQRHLAIEVTLARTHDKQPLARRQARVSDIERHELG